MLDRGDGRGPILAGLLDDADTADSVSRDVFGLGYEFGQPDLDEAT